MLSTWGISHTVLSVKPPKYSHDPQLTLVLQYAGSRTRGISTFSRRFKRHPSDIPIIGDVLVPDISLNLEASSMTRSTCLLVRTAYTTPHPYSVIMLYAAARAAAVLPKPLGASTIASLFSSAILQMNSDSCIWPLRTLLYGYRMVKHSRAGWMI